MSCLARNSFKKFPTSTFPKRFLMIVIGMCILPSLLNLMGIDFSTSHRLTQGSLDESLVTELSYYLSGGIEYGLFEWSCVIISLMTAVFAFARFSNNSCANTPVLCIGFFCLGIIKALYALAIIRVIPSSIDIIDLIPFAWVLSSVINAFIFIACACACACLWTQRHNYIVSNKMIGTLCVLFIAFAYTFVHWMLNLESLPHFDNTNSIIKNPLSLLTLIPFILSAFILWRLYQKKTNYFVAAVIISLIPHIAAQLHFALGHTSLFDNYFNIASGLKVLAYLIPFIGLVLEYQHQALQSSNQLSDREGHLHSIVNETVDGIITINQSGEIETFNKACERIFGYDSTDVIGQNVKMLMPEPYHGEHDKYLSNYHTTGDKKIIGIGREVEGKRKDGTTFPLDLSVSEVRVQGKKFYSGIVRDISERKEAEAIRDQILAQLDEGRARLQAVVEETVDGIITINARGIIETFNKACERIFGYDSTEVIGQNVKILMPNPYHSEHDQYLSNYHNTGDKKVIGIGREVKGKRKNGSIFPLELSVCEVNIKGKKLYSGIVRDVSAKKEAEAKLEKTLEDLKLSNEELEKFAYVASHDLKSPLRAIDNISKWLEEDLAENLDPKSKERMHKLRGRVSRMENLLDDLLEYSRAGRKLEDLGSIQANELIKEVKNLLNVPAHISIQIDASLADITIPRMPLEQVFHNLISNAIKHNDKPQGTIMISGKDIGSFYEFEVKDDGPGIPEKFHKKVFEMFQTLKPRDEVEGSGMGLALVKKIIYRFGGRIDLKSKENEGASFSFTWPKVPLSIPQSLPLNN